MRRSRLARGAATVEMTIAVVILVPTIMYTMFLEDLLYFKLEQYESISSTAWDYHSYDYSDPGVDNAKKQTGHWARLTYCDHTSVYNSYDRNYECLDNHHNGTVTTAHQCWIVPTAQQVHCNEPKDDVLASSQALKGLAGFNGDYNKGGIFECNARLGVMNYFLPNKFFTWSQTRNAGDPSYSVTNKKRYKSGDDNRQNDNVHGNAQGGGEDPDIDTEIEDGASSGTDIVLAKEHFSVMHDPWATNYPPDTDGDNSQGRFHDRMEVYYSAQGKVPGKGYLESLQFLEGAISKDLLQIGAKQDGLGDDPATPTVAWKSENTRDVNQHYASGWDDDRQSSSYGDRKTSYFGHDEGWW